MSTHLVVCLTSRGNYARLGTVLRELDSDDNFDIDIIVAGASMLRRYGTLSDLIREDGLEPTREFYNVIDGGNPVASAKTTGLSMMEFSNVLDELNPDGVITVADRYETMSITLAATYLNIPVVHTQGGEITGSIDERVRHATTKLADYHLVATERSVDVVRQLGEEPDRIFDTGCPSIDLVKDIAEDRQDGYDPQNDYDGVGATVDVDEEYIIVQYHPVPTEYQNEYEKIWELIEAVDGLDIQAFWFWPNMDAGTDKVSKAIREYRDQREPDDIRFYINMRPRDYLTTVNNASCIVGNSSVGIRECSYLGQPSVNIGNRQNNRERADNVLDIKCETRAIRDAIESQLDAGSYARSTLYGEGDAGVQIREILKELTLDRKESMDPSLLQLSSSTFQPS